MSTLNVSTLYYISQQINIYGGSIILFGGIVGNLLNIIVFLSLRTFRENSCAFYLIVMSFVNVGNLMTGLLSRILISGFDIDWTLISSFYCKFRWYGLQFCLLTSFTCICLATIDQCMATCAHVRWRQWSNIKIAYRLTTLFIIIWLLHGILYIIYFDLIPSSITGKLSCTSGNIIFLQYHIYGYLIFLAGVLPLIVTSFFGLLAYNNIQQLARRTIPLVQRELDKQLIMMVLVQVIYNFIFTLPYTILTIITSFPLNLNNPVIIAALDFVTVMTILLYYLSFACPFYIYISASERFRVQLVYVLFEMHLKRWRRSGIDTNQVAPEP